MSNSNTKTTEQRIIEVLKTLLERYANNTFKVITAFNAEEQTDLNGVVALSISNIENLHHGDKLDFKYTVQISGQTLADQDRIRAKINMINQRVLQVISNTASIEMFKDENGDYALPECAAVLFNGGSMSDDGDTRNFSYELQFFMCDCTF